MLGLFSRLAKPTPEKIAKAERVLKLVGDAVGGSYFAYEQGRDVSSSKNPSAHNPNPPPFVRKPSGRRS